MSAFDDLEQLLGGDVPDASPPSRFPTLPKDLAGVDEAGYDPSPDDGDEVVEHGRHEPSGHDRGGVSGGSSGGYDVSLSKRELEIIERCALSRRYFVEVVLGIELEPWQGDVIDALDNGATRVSIRSGNGAGKTALCAFITVHYILFRNDVKVPVTSPSSSQLKDGLIPECSKWIGKLPDFLRDKLNVTSDRITRVDNPANNFVSFRTARKESPESLAGIHAKFVCCIVDEASAVPEVVYEAAQGTLSTPGAIFIMISNPTRLSGMFYNSHHTLKHRWRTFHVTSFDTSRVDQTFVDTITDTWGVDSDQYRVKVMGEFPSREEDSLIPKDLVMKCYGRAVAPVGGDTIWGLDCGRGGDATALISRTENLCEKLAWQNYSDTMQTVGWVKDKWDNTPRDERPTAIYVDSIGIGAGVADRLRELDLPAVDVNVSELPGMKSMYPRMRDELWYKTLEWFETMNGVIDFGDDKKLQERFADELSAPFAQFTSTGKNACESKPAMKSRGVHSPNFADAFCLTFAYSGSVGSGSNMNRAWKKPLEYTAPSSVW